MPRDGIPHIGRPFNDPVSTGQLNRLFQTEGNMRSISVTEPLTIESTIAGGIRLGIIMPDPIVSAGGGEAVGVEEFMLDMRGMEQSDYLEAFSLDEDGEPDLDTNVKIAKPWFLRGKFTWDHEERRLASDNVIRYSYDLPNNHHERSARRLNTEITEDQRIVPAYLTGDRIVAISVSTTVHGATADEDVVVKRLDMNVDARAWAATT
jgi:hypothetical protein